MEPLGYEPGKPIEVDEHMVSTEHDWLYALGDVNGRVLLTHMGKYQAAIAAEHIAGRDYVMTDAANDALSPRVIFTDPQVAAVGHTEQTAKDAGLDVRIVEVETSGNAGGSFYGRGAPGTARMIVDLDKQGRSSARRSPAPRSRTSSTRSRSRSSPRSTWTSCGTRSRASRPAARSGCGCSSPTGSSLFADLDDHALVQRLRAGDEAAFVEIVDRYDRQLRRLARTFVRTDALADDVVQETWLAVFRGIDSFQERSSLKTWIFRILVNRARTRAVREARQVPFSSLSAGEDQEGPTVDPSAFDADGAWTSPPAQLEIEPETQLLAQELRGRLAEVVDTLPEQQRTVILLRDVAGLDGPEVAEALGVSEGNQRVILHRARAKVRDGLAEYVA